MQPPRERTAMSAVDVLRKRLAFAKPFLEALFSLEARVSEWWVAGAHHRLFLAQWGLLPVPEFFDHKIGLYWMWKAQRTPHWVERGVFSLLALEPGCKALELCCGDGFNAHFFFTVLASAPCCQSILIRRPSTMLERIFALKMSLMKLLTSVHKCRKAFSTI